ncbi:MAG: hypothetical protein MUF87_04670 [Anaerolineae bacterium]|nr:hypothetical protein [Anaerolineae bacterium]
MTEQVHDTRAGEGDPSPSRVENNAWERFRRRWFPTAAERTQSLTRRLAMLDRAIEQNGELSSGYVLRGELHLEAGLIDQAVSDFQHALRLGEAGLKSETWGVLAQVMRDRAQRGLERAHRLKNR